MMRPDKAASSQEPAAASDECDAIEPGFPESDEPAIDIGPIDWPEEPPGRATGGSLGSVSERGARAFGASLLGSLAATGTAARR